MARPVPAPRLLGREGFLKVIVDPTLHLISTGVFHLVLVYLVFLFNSRPPDKVQAVCCEQERCARLVIRNLFKNLLYVSNGIGVEWIREIDNLIVWIVCIGLRIRLISGYESIVTQTLRRALDVQTSFRNRTSSA